MLYVKLRIHYKQFLGVFMTEFHAKFLYGSLVIALNPKAQIHVIYFCYVVSY